MAIHLIDFSIQPNESKSLHALRRYDLATLRQCVRGGIGGVEDGHLISKNSRDRLVTAHMIFRADGRNWATAYGVETVRYNSSTIDGSEGYPSRSEV